MFDILKNRTYRHLFLAQIVALVGTGLATVALGLLAFDLAGEGAGLILGGIFTIKMIAYVGIAPVAGAFADRVPRRAMLITLDLIRAGVALVLPFVTEAWQVFGLIFILQGASAAFTPTFQATIPDILPDEGEYTRALSLSRLASDLENIITPTLAGLALLVLSYNNLFWGTFAGFVISAALVASVVLPSPKRGEPRGIYDRTTRGSRLYLATPRLRGLLALNLAGAAAGAMVLVNTVVLVRGTLGMDESALAMTMFGFGLGSMLGAFALPKLLERFSDRPVMFVGAGFMIGANVALAAVIASVGLTWTILFAAWGLSGLGFAMVMTPSGRLLTRSSHAEDRPAVFAAHFALSHACWLIAYPLAGWLMTQFGAIGALVGLSGLGGVGVMIALRVWPKHDPEMIPHAHPELPNDHPHLEEHANGGHAFIIDDLHPAWARSS